MPSSFCKPPKVKQEIVLIHGPAAETLLIASSTLDTTGSDCQWFPWIYESSHPPFLVQPGSGYLNENK
jgi:hypothetical protein